MEGMLFSVLVRFFSKHVGLWFAVQTGAIEPVFPLLRYLADTGVGGHRTSGFSQFSIPVDEVHEVSLPSSLFGDRLVALSRYIPAPGEVAVEDQRATYRLATIQPKHESRFAAPGQRIYKGRFLVVEEGSILPVVGDRRSFYGRVVPVGRNTEDPEGFPVWHNGMTIPVFMAEESSND